MNFRAAFQKHLVAVAASMAGGALAGGAIVLALTSATPQLPTTPPAPRVAEVVSPSPLDTPADPSLSPTDAPTPTPTAAPTAAPAPVAPATAAPTSAPPPPPSCPTGQAILSQSGTGRWDGTFTVPSECATYTYRWTFGPVPPACRTWTLAFYPNVNGQGHEYTQASAASGGGSESVHNPGARVAGEVNLYNNIGCPAIPWTIMVTAG